MREVINEISLLIDSLIDFNNGDCDSGGDDEETK